MFQFPALAPYISKVISLQDTGLSHSEIHGSIHGSRVICTSPWLFAAYHVLHRLREPRHPPCALSYFCYHAHTLNCIIQSGWYILSALLVLTKIIYSFSACYIMSKIFLKFRILYWESTFLWRILWDWLASQVYPYILWRITDSNRWPPACKAGALASWANPPWRCFQKRVQR